MQQQREGFEKLSMKDTFNIFNLVCNGLGACVVVFLRTGFGKEYPGSAGLAGLIIMVLYASFAHVPEMFPYIGVWLVVVALQRMKTFHHGTQGRRRSFPLLGLSVACIHCCRSSAKKRRHENSLSRCCALAIGGALMHWSRGVGAFRDRCRLCQRHCRGHRRRDQSEETASHA